MIGPDFSRWFTEINILFSILKLTMKSMLDPAEYREELITKIKKEIRVSKFETYCIRIE